MIVKLLTEHHLKFLSLKGGCRGSSESTLVKMSNCWKSHAAALNCNAENDKVHKLKKWQNLSSGQCPNHMHIFTHTMNKIHAKGK